MADEARDGNWLKRIIDDAAAKFATWPQWKRDAYKAEMEWAKKQERRSL